MVINLSFRGMRWQLPEVLQGEDFATVAHNMYRRNAALEPLLTGAKSTLVPTEDLQFADKFFLHDDKFLAFDYDTECATTQVIGDVGRRLYFISKIPGSNSGTLVMQAITDITTTNPLDAGIRTLVGLVPPQPDWITGTVNGEGMAITHNGGANPETNAAVRDTALETAFVYTVVNKYGEESAPSKPTRAFLYVPGDTQIRLVGAFQTAPSPDAVGFRVYMLVDGAYRRIGQFDETIDATVSTAEIPNLTAIKADATDDWIDFTVDHALAQEQLISAEWDFPPVNIVSLASLDNGVLAIATEHDVYLSEPYYWHAYPEANRYSVAGTIKRIANIGGGFAVMTDRGTQFFFGADPGGMIQSEVISPYSISDPQSFTAYEGGGLYVCDDGLVLLSAEGARVVTDGFIDREQWRARVKVDECRTAMYEGRILVATRNPENNNPIGYCVNMAAGEVTSFDISENALKSGFFRDPRNNDVGYVTDGSGLTVFNRGQQLVALWESGDIWLPDAAWFNTLHVQSDEYPVDVRIKRYAPQTGENTVAESSDLYSVTSGKPRRVNTKRSRKIRLRVESGQQVGRVALATDMRLV